MNKSLMILSGILVLLLGLPVCALGGVQEPGSGLTEEGGAHEDPGLSQEDLEALLFDLENAPESAESRLNPIRTLGLLVFSTPFNTFDGLGDGPYNPLEVPATTFGHRPTLQGNGTFLRLNGLDAQSCNECHTIVSNATRPPTTGIAGVGGIVQSAFPLVTLADFADTFDDRISYVPGHDPDLPLVRDGVADLSGRFINPPFLFGGGGVELIGKEMTTNLQEILADARKGIPGQVWSLTTHGVYFGYVVSLGDGKVELHNEGVGLEDPTLTEEEQLVVRPFGRKGENFSMRDFDRGAMQFHFGIQATEVVGFGVDEDLDGVVDEVTDAEMTTLHVFDVTNPPSYMAPLSPDAQVGSELFKEVVGCADCHIPQIVTEGRKLPLAHPEVATDPSANVYTRIPLNKFGFANSGPGLVVPLFSDLKRHYMGEDLAETCELCEGIADDEFITARLWGIADTAPYLHDGRATTLRQAIEMHGGEASYAVQNFLDLSLVDQLRLIEFLRHLRTPDNPNQDILPK